MSATTEAIVPSEPRLLTEEQTCVYVAIPRRTLTQMVSMGQFPKPVPIRKGMKLARKRWVREELDAWINDLRDYRDNPDKAE